MMNLRAWGIVALALVILGSVLWVTAQDTTTTTCQPALDALWTLASEACVGRPQGYVCNGASAPAAEPPGAGFSLASVGSLVDVAAIDSLHSTAISLDAGFAGVVFARVPPPVELTIVLVGDVLVQDVTLPDFPTWQSLVVQTGDNTSTCPEMPRNSFIAQVVQINQAVRIAINGVSIDLVGTMVVQTQPGFTTFYSLSGGMRLLAYNTEHTAYAGQQVSVPHTDSFAVPSGGLSDPAAFDRAALDHLPTALLDNPVIVPQPGIVYTSGIVNLRAAPSTDAALLAEVPPGEILSVLGMNNAGTWYHVQTFFGLTGWMFAELLDGTLGAITAYYDLTPAPPAHYGTPELVATVIAPEGVYLRDAPDVQFATIGSLAFGTTVNLVARSPYSPWVFVEAGGLSGWVALITLETDAYIYSLPIDYQVPPPPGPTRIPGSWGNAFPDPNDPTNP